MTDTSIGYVLLCRHAEGQYDGPAPLTDSGRKAADDVASALRETLTQSHIEIRIDSIRIAPSAQAKATAEPLQEVANELFAIAPRSGTGAMLQEPGDMDLEPRHFWSEARGQAGYRVADELKRQIEQLPRDGPGNAVLIVGHSPQLGWIAERLVGHPIPLARSEIVCIELFRSRTMELVAPLLLTVQRTAGRPTSASQLVSRGRVVWSIAPSDPKALEELRDKIRSKMDLAKTLAAFITPGLGVMLGFLADPARLHALAAPENAQLRDAILLSTAFFLSAIVLYLASMYHYDRLLMPTRFWGESLRSRYRSWPLRRSWLVDRPPSSDVIVLWNNMMRIWNWVFTPATVAVVLGLGTLAFAVFAPTLNPGWLAVAVIGLLTGIWYVLHFRPVLGSED